MKFFELSDSQNEDKVIARQERIYANKMTVSTGGVNLNLVTTSRAPKQKIRFYLDALEVRIFGDDYGDDPTDFEEKIYRVGQWFEMEDQEQGVHFNSGGFYYFTFVCQGGPGTYSWNLTIEQNQMPEREITRLFISAVSFSDSFVMADVGWFNANDPENLLDKVEPEVATGLPDGGSENDILTIGESGPKWTSPAGVTATMPVTDGGTLGVVEIDGETLITDAGITSVNIDGDTIYYDGDTGLLKAKGGGGTNYVSGEFLTGDTWKGKPIYGYLFEVVFTAATYSLITGLTGIDEVIGYGGKCRHTANSTAINFDFSNSSVSGVSTGVFCFNGYAIPALDTSGNLGTASLYTTYAANGRADWIIYYTKL